MTTNPLRGGPRDEPELRAAPGLALAAGQRLDLGSAATVFRLRSGLLVGGVADEAPGRVDLVLRPGDLVGAEALAGGAALPGLWIKALVPSRLDGVDLRGPAVRLGLLAEAYGQLRRQGRDVQRLRAGPVADRVRSLLGLLGQSPAGGAAAGADATAFPMPPQKLLAALVDTSPETVCRVLAQLRDAGEIRHAASGRSRFTAAAAVSLGVPPAPPAARRPANADGARPPAGA
ncbi:Crp/Fnr family transcriptional regulator [Piscinibacter sakaiensis]|uniref:HTH crp-type domain-containing protein n=1 Tax=Piscinibacter sakaiensis TaxID=1547922 RepID=A0A0K8P4Z9_PISS1|nr:Crp/Fnr family transcriptional regulator [Piscinibacter sakaiensis]GAP37240.1 hypothetical protein ISF6_3095 [Piscinibacter sakaiensis]